ncbi:hypothetical protein FIA58_003770 [Flavobacterium jejuense]|uniref:Uncharacterized protein n=1 Tax=Flavobacterium jejuense TaxID=1544455 RepID=A0ABX0IMH2_9FLAO|nr:hypothetical protein [Flavobacterium jejuense]NHN24786.1 hypothetical protein [Flavobacterium jejuense]
METYDDINETIRLTTIRIQEEYPELMKYITEIPENYASLNHKGINNNDLKEYLNSLIELIASYAKEH